MYLKSYISFSFYHSIGGENDFFYIKLPALVAFCHSLLHQVSNLLTNGIDYKRHIVTNATKD